MNIPEDALQALLRPALAERNGLTRQRALYVALRDAILDGTLKAHSLLPGSRVLAKTLAVSRNTVNAALEQLAIEGFVQRERQGTRVLMLASAPAVQNTPVVSLAQRVQTLPHGVTRNSPVLAFTPGLPAVNYFPMATWRRLSERVWRDGGSALLGYGDSAGELRLRTAIARHLALARGIHCEAEQIVITEGAQDALMLCIHLLCDPGDMAWVEEPGYNGAKSAFLAAVWSLVWVSLSLLFNAAFWWYLVQNEGRAVADTQALAFLTGYLIEKALAVDNVFVWLMLFSYFSVPAALQRRVLIYGVLGAIVLRTIMIFAGSWLISQFEWLLYVFGAFLLFTGVKMALAKEDEGGIGDKPLVRWLRSHLRMTDKIENEHFFVRKNA